MKVTLQTPAAMDDKQDLIARNDAARQWTRVFMPLYDGAVLCGVRQKAWTGVSAVVKELKCSGPFRADFHSDCSRLLVMLEEIGGHTEARTSPSRPTAIRHDTVHQMNYAPSGAPIWAHGDSTRYMRHITFTFDHATVCGMMDEDVDLGSMLQPRFMFFDERLLHLAKLFALECEADSGSDLLYGDTLSLALLLRLSQLGQAQGRTLSRGGLSAQQLRVATEYLSNDLRADVSLQELANLTQLSRSHFCRAFRASTGMPPHQWRMHVKVKKAQEFLIEGLLTLADVSQVTGFADQAHLTRVFSRIVGASPGVWRRQRSK
jgi:AraC family transcriptional regulator